jgi:hypothetical protein
LIEICLAKATYTTCFYRQIKIKAQRPYSRSTSSILKYIMHSFLIIAHSMTELDMDIQLPLFNINVYKL